MEPSPVSGGLWGVGVLGLLGDGIAHGVQGNDSELNSGLGGAPILPCEVRVSEFGGRVRAIFGRFQNWGEGGY